MPLICPADRRIHHLKTHTDWLHPTSHRCLAHDDDAKVGVDDIDVDDEVLDGTNLRGDDPPSQVTIVGGRFWIWPEGNSFGLSRTAANAISYIIQQNYKKLYKTFRDVKDKDTQFSQFQEKCCWEKLDDEKINKNYFGRTSRRLSDMLRRARECFLRLGIRPKWIGTELFDDLLKYWEMDEFKVKSENGKKMRALEKGGALMLLEALVLLSILDA